VVEEERHCFHIFVSTEAILISIAEVELRAAHTDWQEAKAKWSQALADINEAKRTWEQAQAKFYQDKNIMTSAAGCGGCIGRRTGGQ